jgi:hypothetical protein
MAATLNVYLKRLSQKAQGLLKLAAGRSGISLPNPTGGLITPA